MLDGNDNGLDGLVDGDTAFGDVATLTVLLGNGARVRILAALLSEDHHDLNVTQIAELAGVHRTTVYDHLDELENLGVITQTREVGGSPMYEVNTDSVVAQDLKRLEEDLLEQQESAEPTG